MRAACLLLCLSFAIITSSEGLTIPSCSTSSGAIQIEEGTQDYLLACGDLNIGTSTLWKYQGRHPMDTMLDVARCAGTNCTSLFDVTILASINPNTARSHVILPDVISGRFPDGTWVCENGGQSAQCQIDVIYATKDTNCAVVIDEDNGMVNGECQISHTFSSKGDYSCTWFEGNDNQADVEISQSNTVVHWTNCTQGGRTYRCGNCSFHASLPLNNGGYSYRPVISPGEVSPSVRYSVLPKQNTTPISTQSSIVSSASPGTTSTRVAPPAVTEAEHEKDEEWTTRAVGIGIGVGGSIVIALIVVFIVIACKRRRKEKKRNCGDTFADIRPTEDSRKSDFKCDNGFASNHQHPGFRASVENDYSTIPLPETVKESSRMTPHQALDKGNHRNLPPVPPVHGSQQTITVGDYSTLTHETAFEESDVKADNRELDKKTDLDSEQEAEISGRHLVTGCSSLYKEPLPPIIGSGPKKNGYLTPSTKKGMSDKDGQKKEEECGIGKTDLEDRNGEEVAPGGGMEEGNGMEDEENLNKEVTEKAGVKFDACGFQEKGADYIYMRNENIPLSDPI